eukprot:707395-Alexandrium_andersonii.AAC.1
MGFSGVPRWRFGFMWFVCLVFDVLFRQVRGINPTTKCFAKAACSLWQVRLSIISVQVMTRLVMLACMPSETEARWTQMAFKAQPLGLR